MARDMRGMKVNLPAHQEQIHQPDQLQRTLASKGSPARLGMQSSGPCTTQGPRPAPHTPTPAPAPHAPAPQPWPGKAEQQSTMAAQQMNPLAAISGAVQNVLGGLEDFKQSLQRKPMTFQGTRRSAPARVHMRKPAASPLARAPFAAIIPGDSVGEAVLTTGLLNFFSLYNSALVVRLVLTWFPNPPEVIVSPLATVTDPYLNLFRGIIPPIGGTLDLSPILAFVTLNFFTNTAAALPCEVDTDGRPLRKAPEPSSSGPFSFLQPSRVQQAWAKRVQAQRSGADEGSSSGASA